MVQLRHIGGRTQEPSAQCWGVSKQCVLSEHNLPATATNALMMENTSVHSARFFPVGMRKKAPMKANETPTSIKGRRLPKRLVLWSLSVPNTGEVAVPTKEPTSSTCCDGEQGGQMLLHHCRACCRALTVPRLVPSCLGSASTTWVCWCVRSQACVCQWVYHGPYLLWHQQHSEGVDEQGRSPPERPKRDELWHG